VEFVIGLAAAVVLGALLGVVLARLRARRRPAGSPPHDVASLLRAYRRGQFQQVVEAAPGVVAGIGAVTGSSWRGRVELVWGHSLFELDRYDEALVHLENGLDDSPGLEADARFRHCLGYAQQKTGRLDAARDTYERLLADLDLDPAIRDGVERNLAELDR
jgi:tetratricopeptide (TPR) repeat protein